MKQNSFKKNYTLVLHQCMDTKYSKDEQKFLNMINEGYLNSCIEKTNQDMKEGLRQSSTNSVSFDEHTNGNFSRQQPNNLFRQQPNNHFNEQQNHQQNHQNQQKQPNQQHLQQNLHQIQLNHQQIYQQNHQQNRQDQQRHNNAMNSVKKQLDFIPTESNHSESNCDDDLGCIPMDISDDESSISKRRFVRCPRKNNQTFAGLQQSQQQLQKHQSQQQLQQPNSFQTHLKFNHETPNTMQYNTFSSNHQLYLQQKATANSEDLYTSSEFLCDLDKLL